MTVEIKESCCCGAEFSVRDTTVFGNTVYSRYKQFLEAHKICREADSMKNKTTTVKYKDDE